MQQCESTNTEMPQAGPASWHIGQTCVPCLQTRFKARSWSKFLLDYLFTYNKRLVAAKTTGDFPPPWTEYTLYWIYAAHADVWDDYHCKVRLHSPATAL